MNLNYIGSVAERFMQFRSGVEATEGVGEDVFNNLVVYLPSNLAEDNLVEIDIFSATKDPVVQTANVQNYREVLKGDLLHQWEPVFRQDTNFDVSITVVVFFIPDAMFIPEGEAKALALRDLADLSEGSLSTAQGVLDNASGEFNTAVNDLGLAQEAYDIAVLALAEDPEDTALIDAFNLAEIALNSAVTDRNSARDSLDAAQLDRDEAFEDFTAKDSKASSAEEFVVLCGGSYADLMVIEQNEISYEYLTRAFMATHFLGFFKFIFSSKYDGKNSIEYDDRPYFDLALCLSKLCQENLSLSFAIHFCRLDVPTGDVDTNVFKALSLDAGEEQLLVEGFAGDVEGYSRPRSELFYGMLYHMEALNTWVIAHTEQSFIISEIFSAWFAQKNATDSFIGNKLAKLRLTGARIKPCGVPSLLDASVNTNLELKLAKRLDARNIGYLITVADDSTSDSMMVRAVSVTGYPVIASMMSKWVDYTTSMEIAKMLTRQSTLTDPVLRNERTYERIKGTLLRNIQVFARIGRISNIQLNFPTFSELPKSKTDITVTAGWTATYVDDLERVVMTGSIIV